MPGLPVSVLLLCNLPDTHLITPSAASHPPADTSKTAARLSSPKKIKAKQKLQVFARGRKIPSSQKAPNLIHSALSSSGLNHLNIDSVKTLLG